jgi:hypothetical protein
MKNVTVESVFQAILKWREQHGGVDIDDAEVDSWRDRSAHFPEIPNAETVQAMEDARANRDLEPTSIRKLKASQS